MAAAKEDAAAGVSLVVNLTRLGDLLQSQALITDLHRRGRRVQLVCLDNFADALSLLRHVERAWPLPGAQWLAALDRDWRGAAGDLLAWTRRVREVAQPQEIINLTTTSITSTLSESPFTAAEYCARIAGVLAGLPLTRSSTYYVLEDIVDCAVPSDPDDRIDGGELVIVFDSEKYKIGRGVNSLTTISDGKTADMKKIKIIEGMDLYNDDICTTFADNYVGKRINDYDSKQAFVAAILAYQKGITGDVLDSSYDNTVSIDLDAQRAYLDGKGIDTADMDDVAIARANTGSKVFVASDIKFVDAMEDLHLTTNM